jgi:hypothetical protein
MALAPVGIEPKEITLHQLSQAKRLMRQGHDLHETALIIGVRSRDLDLSLWRNLANLPEGW